MRTIFFHTTYLLLVAMSALIFACSSEDDNNSNPVPTPEVPIAPASALHIDTDGFVTKVDLGYASIVFPDNVKGIRARVFASNQDIKKVTLNEGLETIENSAFSNSSLMEVNFPSTLKEIGEYAFYYCENLTGADLSISQIKVLPEAVFELSGIQSLKLPVTLQTIEITAFQATTKLKSSVIIPEGVGAILTAAFRGSAISAIELPNNISHLATRVFEHCTELTRVTTYGEITNDNNVADIQSFCFNGCSSLAYLDIPTNIRKIGRKIVADSPKLESILIPLNIKEIGYAAFLDTGVQYVIVNSPYFPIAVLEGGKWDAFPATVKLIRVPGGTSELYKVDPGWNEYADKIEDLPLS